MVDVERYLPHGMYRNRALLDLAHDVDVCQNCGGDMPDGCEPAHSDEGVHGKGKGLKAHDCFFAALCHACHCWYDNQGGRDKDPTRIYEWHEKNRMFERAMARTWLWLWKMKKLKVA